MHTRNPKAVQFIKSLLG